LFGLGDLVRRERIGLAHDRDDVDPVGEAPHELDVEFSES
jgi:hypothetical protein